MNNVTNSQDLNSIMNRIKNRRLELGFSYQDLAQKTNMSKSTLQRYETGSIKNMPIDKLSVIANALNVDPIWLLGFTTTKSSTEYSLEDAEHLKNFRKLNDLGRAKVIAYTSDLIDNKKYLKAEEFSNINKQRFWDEFSKEHLLPNAACELEGFFSKDDYKHDEELMKDDTFWNK